MALNTVVIEAGTGRVVTVAYGEPLLVDDQPYEFAWHGGPMVWSPTGRYFALTSADPSAGYAPYLAIIEPPGVGTR